MTYNPNVTPINEFPSQETANSVLKWWMDKLCMNDWIISVSVVQKEDMSEPERSGEISMFFESKEAAIRILNPKCYPQEAITKYCAELFLVHELLHTRYNWLVCENTYEGKYVDEMEHQNLDQMAKTLIMVKYNLPLEWFCN